jgi:uncharacterized protein YkwD
MEGILMENRFDELAKALAEGVTRRDALQRVAGVLAGALLASMGLRKAALGAPAINSTCETFCTNCGITPVGGVAYGACVSSCEQCLNSSGCVTCPAPGQTNVVCSNLEHCVSQQQIIASIIDDNGFKAQLLTLINNFRSGSGLSTLARVQGLENVAQSHSNGMSACSNLTHLDPCSGASAACQTACQGSPDPHCLDNCAVNERISAAGYSSLLTGENIATGLTPQAVFNGWKASPGHRMVLLTPGFTQIGLGLAVSCNLNSGVTLWWTADFGTGGDSTPVQPGPPINAQAEAAQLVAYLQAADAAYCRGDLATWGTDYQSFVDLWAQLGLPRDCVLTLKVLNCLTSVIFSLTNTSVSGSYSCPTTSPSTYTQCAWRLGGG